MDSPRECRSPAALPPPVKEARGHRHNTRDQVVQRSPSSTRSGNSDGPGNRPAREAPDAIRATDDCGRARTSNQAYWDLRSVNNGVPGNSTCRHLRTSANTFDGTGEYSLGPSSARRALRSRERTANSPALAPNRRAEEAIQQNPPGLRKPAPPRRQHRCRSECSSDLLHAPLLAERARALRFHRLAEGPAPSWSPPALATRKELRSTPRMPRG